MTSYDQKINKLFYYWLVTSFLMVFLMVIVGGFTRLTNSGLSITEWELFKGILPPLNDEIWNKYFLLYKQIPQYQIVNFDMTLNEFKVIFYWEYLHRVLGRVIGILFLIPLIYFYYKRKISDKYLSICFIILFLIIFQGILGWYMVKSGLINNITVSHYRLSAHLGVAFIIIAMIFWNLLNFRKRTIKNFFNNHNINYFFIFLIFLIFLQIIMGAFVSGLDAGKIYQTWPLMDYSYFPNDTYFNKFTDVIDFNNQGLVQFYHRNIAYFILVYVFLIGFYIFKKKSFIYISLFILFFTFCYYR